MAAVIQIKHRCPHCNELCDFLLDQLSETMRHVDPNRSPPVWKPRPPLGSVAAMRNEPPVREDTFHEGVALSRCNNCRNPVMFIVEMPAFIFSHYSTAKSHGDRDRLNIGPPSRIVATFPEGRSFDSHPAWPSNVQAPFVDLQKMVAERKQPAFIVSGCRSVLDVVLKHLEGQGGNIFERIDDLAKKGLITGALRDWSHELRKRGADATHDLEGGTIDQAAEFVAFIKLLLHVCYELPASIAAKRTAAAET